MTDKEALDRLIGINMSLEQKQALIDVIKNIAVNNGNTNIDKPIVFTVNAASKSVNIYDKDYSIEVTDYELILYNTELKDKIYSELLNNKKIVIKIINDVANNASNSTVFSYYIWNERLCLEFIYIYSKRCCICN